MSPTYEYLTPAIAANSGGREALGPWLVAAAALVVAVLGRRRLPTGVAAGLFVAAVSGLLMLLNYDALREPGAGGFLLAASLTGLAVLWFIVVVWVERDPVREEDDDARARRAARRSLGVHAVAVAGLLAAATVLATWSNEGGGRAPSLVALTGLLIAVAAGCCVWRPGTLSRWAIFALLGALLNLVVPRTALVARETMISLAMLVAGATALVVVIATLLADWRRRVHIWQTEPERLIEPPPAHRGLYGTVVLICGAVGAGGVLVPGAVLTPLAVVLAAFACLTVGHRRRSNGLGEMGLALVAVSIVTAALAWLPASPVNGLLGLTAAGLLLLWLARFWHQQLDGGRPWTTAGRLIPTARSLSYAAAGGLLAMAALHLLRSTPGASPAGWQTPVAGLFMLLYWFSLTRDAVAQGAVAGALAACLALVAALVPVGQFVTAVMGVPAAVLLAAGGLLLAIVAGPPRRAPASAWPHDAYIGGLLPVAAAFALTQNGAAALPVASLVLVVVCVLLAWTMRWGVYRRLGPLPQS